MNTRTLRGSTLGVEYTFTVGISDRVASPFTPYAHEASAVVDGRRFTRYGNNDDDAVRAMMDAIREHVERMIAARAREARFAARREYGHTVDCVCNVCGNCPDCDNGTRGPAGTYCQRCHRTQRPVVHDGSCDDAGCGACYEATRP